MGLGQIGFGKKFVFGSILLNVAPSDPYPEVTSSFYLSSVIYDHESTEVFRGTILS